MKKICITVATFLLIGFFSVSAQTKPAPGTDPESLSYVFYLYYNNGQLFGDRDYAVNYDVLSEKFTPETAGSLVFRGEIVNNKSEVVKIFQFDPQKGISNFNMGKVTVRGPYATDGAKANFFDASGNPVLSIFVSSSAICNGDGFCNEQEGENSNTCVVDCPVVRNSPVPLITPSVENGSFDLNQILIYAVGGLGVGVLAWLGWKWWRKRKEGDFPLPPRPSAPQPPSMPPPLPPNVPLG